MTEAVPMTPAAETPAAPAIDPMAEMQYSFDNFILFFCAVLVIFMQAGFALVETGLNAAKNAVNIMFKNFMDFMVGGLLFFFVGFAIMYPGDAENKDEPAKDNPTHYVKNIFGYSGVVGVNSTGWNDAPANIAAGKLNPYMNFMFQVAFAATAATIVSGSVAGRIKFPAYLIYTAAITGFIYPVSGMWMWGYGWLWDKGFVDFAGSAVVHMVGGMAGLAGAIALGPRIGRYVNGKPVPMPGHNLPFVALGVFILIIGWYGFNPGSQLLFFGKGNVDVVAMVAVNTTLAACAGSITGMLFPWIMYGKPDLSLSLNGCLGGLVAITANCHCVTPVNAVIIGAAAGVIVILFVILLDKLQIDDPVGAFPVHGGCGMWAIVATAIFGDKALASSLRPELSLSTQLTGLAAIGGWALGSSLLLFFILKAVGLLRVPAEEEVKGLDITEHGMYAYPASQVNESYS